MQVARRRLDVDRRASDVLRPVGGKVLLHSFTATLAVFLES
jgi:hypothetical protein